MITSNTAAQNGSSPSPLFGTPLDIATAPKDGTRILICLEHETWTVGSWDYRDDQRCWVDDGYDPMPFILDPTHWMPLPPAVPNTNYPEHNSGESPQNQKA
jgi:hypothetical protein